MDNSIDIVPYENKSFDELLDEIENSWRQFFKLKNLMPLIFEKGREGGMSDDVIRTTITGRLGIPYRTMLRYIPEDRKREYNRYQEEKSAKVAELPVIIPHPEPVIIEQEPESEPTGEIVRIEMDWGHCNFFVNWFRNELKSHEKDKKGRYIIEYDLLTKQISVDMEEN